MSNATNHCEQDAISAPIDAIAKGGASHASIAAVVISAAYATLDSSPDIASHASAAATYRSRDHRLEAIRQTSTAKTRGVILEACLDADRLPQLLVACPLRVLRREPRGHRRVARGTCRSTDPWAVACRAQRRRLRACLFACRHRRTSRIIRKRLDMR